MIEEEAQAAPERNEDDLCDDEDECDTSAAAIALSGFCLSVFFIWWAMIILVRFYIFDNILYNLFIFCMLVTGEQCKDFVSIL